MQPLVMTFFLPYSKLRIQFTQVVKARKDTSNNYGSNQQDVDHKTVYKSSQIIFCFTLAGGNL
ncbi:hypothetical protein [Endozoicomonas sp. ONNA2]|uniref:hypothetical protein n=1 Tax=Endozoicomonas sp. ONNA2 TaxID=2828741 RepID=UPI002149870D|nr:hypothetical protein [Endozoicomonas sp. ONNA2]